MAKKKTQAVTATWEKPADYHKSGFMVRLPKDYREKMERLKAKTHRPFAVDVRLALDRHFKEEGIS